MARQVGPLFIIGAVDDMIFYRSNDNYYMRRKGEPTAGTKKRMQQDKGYALLQLRKREFGQASELVKSFYYTLPKGVRKQGVFGVLTGKAVRLLRKGVPDEEIKELVRKEVLPVNASSEKTMVISSIEDSSTMPGFTKAVKEKKVSWQGFSQWRVSTRGQLEKEGVAMCTYMGGRELTERSSTPITWYWSSTYAGGERQTQRNE